MRLIEAAEILLVRKSFDNASVEEISERSGYSRGAFYSNFDNKLAIDTEPEWADMYTEAAKLLFDRMTVSEISH